MELIQRTQGCNVYAHTVFSKTRRAAEITLCQLATGHTRRHTSLQSSFIKAIHVASISHRLICKTNGEVGSVKEQNIELTTSSLLKNGGS